MESRQEKLKIKIELKNWEDLNAFIQQFLLLNASYLIESLSCTFGSIRYQQ